MSRISPKAKIIGYIIIAFSVFFINSSIILLVLLLILLLLASFLPFSKLKRGIIPIIFFLVFTFASNILFQEGEEYFRIFSLVVTAEGLRRGIILTLRLLILITGAKILTASTEPRDIVDAMVNLLGPAGRIGFVKDLMTTMTLTMQLLPVVYDEATVVFKTVRDAKDKGVAGRIRLSVSMLSKLFEKSLDRAKQMQNGSGNSNE